MMAKVFAAVPGAEVQIPPYGTATNDRPCLVPAAVGEELSKVEGLRVEPDAVFIDFGTGVPVVLHSDQVIPRRKIATQGPKSEKE